MVANHEGKLRIALNLRHLNWFLCKDRFKYEDFRIAVPMFKKDDYFFLFNLKSGYYHLDIFEPHQTYLGSSWQVIVFTVLPFGLVTASYTLYTFTKLLRHFVWFRV